jgi:hypothetical protein
MGFSGTLSNRERPVGASAATISPDSEERRVAGFRRELCISTGGTGSGDGFSSSTFNGTTGLRFH